MSPTRIISRRRLLGSAVAASVASLPARSEIAAAMEDGFRILEARDGALRLAPEPAGETGGLGL